MIRLSKLLKQQVNVFLITCNHVICACIDLEFLTAIKHRFSRKPMESMMVKCTKSMQTSFSGEYNISLSDGAPKFKSSTMQLWPIQFIINELPHGTVISLHSHA